MVLWMRLLGLGELLLVQLIFAGYFTLSKKALNGGISPEVFALARDSGGSILLLLATAIKHRGDMPKITERDAFRFFVLGATGVWAGQLVGVVALSYLSALAVSVLTLLAPIFTLILAAILKIETLTFTKLLGAGLALAGAAIIILFAGHTSSKSSDRAGSPLFGVLLMVLVTSCSAVFVTLQRYVLHKYDALTCTAYSYTAGAVLVAMSVIPNPPSHWSLKGGYVAVAYAIIMSSCVAYALNAHGNSLTSPALVNIAAVGSPLFTAVLSKLFLKGTEFGVYHIIGGAVTVLGFGVLSWAKYRDWKEAAREQAATGGGTGSDGARVGSPAGVPYTDLAEEGNPLISPTNGSTVADHST